MIFHQIGELPEEIIKTALEEDVDVIAISASTGGHNWFCSKVMEGLKEKKAENYEGSGREPAVLRQNKVLPNWHPCGLMR